MTAIKLDGKATANKLKEKIAKTVKLLKAQGTTVRLGTILVGNDKGSQIYVNAKHKDCAEVGIETIDIKLPETASEQEILNAVNKLNNDPNCTAFIVQLPLPKGINQNKILNAINPKKDADGLHPENLGNLVLDDVVFPLEVIENFQKFPSVKNISYIPLPCTPIGILTLLLEYNIKLEGKQLLIIGRGLTVGRPLGLLVSSKKVNATAILAHSKTLNLQEQIDNAQIVVAAIGVPKFITKTKNANSVMIDVGVSRDENGKVVGDLDFENLVNCIDYITPNPGGVGPMTRVSLLINTLCLELVKL